MYQFLGLWWIYLSLWPHKVVTWIGSQQVSLHLGTKITTHIFLSRTLSIPHPVSLHQEIYVPHQQSRVVCLGVVCALWCILYHFLDFSGKFFRFSLILTVPIYISCYMYNLPQRHMMIVNQYSIASRFMIVLPWQYSPPGSPSFFFLKVVSFFLVT